MDTRKGGDMSVEEVSRVIDPQEANTDSSGLPDDINIEKRKAFIREELRKLLGKPLSQKEVEEKRRLKTIKFNKEKVRKKLANKSRRRNITR